MRMPISTQESIAYAMDYQLMLRILCTAELLVSHAIARGAMSRANCSQWGMKFASFRERTNGE